MPIFETDDQLTISTDGTAGPYVVVTPNRFIRQTHADDAPIDPLMLATYLGEQGFGAEQIAGLLHEYELGRSLLSDDEGHG